MLDDELQEDFPEGQEGPRMFEVDTSLTPLQAVMEWAVEGNPLGQRVSYILSIPAAAAESSLEECRNVLLPLLSQLAFDDSLDIKAATAEVLGPLGPILASKDPHLGQQGGDDGNGGDGDGEGSSDAMDLLVLAHRLLGDAERGVQEAAASSVAQFAGLLSPEHRRQHLSAVIDALMHNYDDEQMQECAVDLLSKLAERAGPEHPGWCQECALPRMLKLAMHRDYNIRVHTVAGLVKLAACLPEEQRTAEVLPAFAELCSDQVWSVRQDCASELSNLAAELPRQAVRDQLLPLWSGLAGDVSAWVQAAARRQAGPLLACVHPDDAPPGLIEAFVEAALGPATLTEACAHFMPAVLLNLGPQRWPELRPAVAALAESEYISVRVVLAESVARLAQMLGPQAVADDLLPIIQRLSADECQVVADALAMHISALLAALPPAARLAQLGFLARMHPEDGSSCGQWRMRLLVAEQLAGVAALLEQQGRCEVLLPATLRLCEDPVAAVREAAAAQLGGMVRRLLQHDGSSGCGGEAGEAGSREASSGAQAAEQQQPGEEAAALAGGMQQLALSDEQGGCAAAAASPGGDAAPAAPTAEAPAAPEPLPAAAEAAEAAQEPGKPEEEARHSLEAPLCQEVQQIVRHMVELQRSACHRARQTYLLFCSALLLPVSPSAPPDGDGAAGPAAAAGAALSSAVAHSGIVQGLLEGALALAADPVPNVRLGVARLLCALRQQQPQLADGAPRVAETLAALAADADRDVAQTAAE